MTGIELLIWGAVLVAELLYIGLVILLTIEEIINWFNRVTHKVPADVGFSVAEALSSGNYKVVQGVFNRDTNKITEGRRMDVKELDSTLKNYHASHKVVIYE